MHFLTAVEYLLAVIYELSGISEKPIGNEESISELLTHLTQPLIIYVEVCLHIYRYICARPRVYTHVRIDNQSSRVEATYTFIMIMLVLLLSCSSVYEENGL
jgi:hypothetical protein